MSTQLTASLGLYTSNTKPTNLGTAWPITVMQGGLSLSCIDRDANAQTEPLSACVLNALILAIAAADIACSSGASKIPLTENAQAVLNRFLG